MLKIIIGVVIATVVVIGGFLLLDPKQSNPDITVVDSKNSYTIEGEVNKSGTYKLEGEALTFQDLLNAAGGLTSNGDERTYFETTEITINSTYYVAPKYDVNDVCNNQEIKKVNINSDNETELLKISGITNAIASSIVSYRTENGSFTYLEQLMDVYGIGNATYRKIRNYVILHEWSFF